MQIGSYQVLFELARGGMGTVYLARALGVAGFERLVAIKRAHRAPAHSTSAADALITEARMAACVHHANVVGMHHAGHDEQGYYFVCDYVEGESLAGLLRRACMEHGRVPLRIVMRIALDALAGLHAVHQARDPSGTPIGMLHRDVSLQNLIVGSDGVTRLTDFGVAKSTLSSEISEEHYVQGKLIYMAPEYLNRQPVDQTLDIYAMGITLYTALAGRQPWHGQEQAAVVQAILGSGVPALSTIGTVAPPAIERIVMRACAAEARQRFQSAREMLDALEAASVEAGELARHVEVAEYVEHVVGAELAARREVIRSFSDPDRPSTTPTQRVQDSPEDLSLEQVLAPTPQEEGRKPWRLALGAVALITCGLVWAAHQARSGASASTADPAHTAPSVPPRPAAIPLEPAAVDTRDAPVTAPPAGSTSATVTQHAPPRKSRSRRSPPPRRPRPTSPSPSLNQISTDNPYR